MARKGGVNVCVVGLGFGGAFAPIYRAHPDVGDVGICDTNEARLAEYGDQNGFTFRYTSFDAVLEDRRWDAVHIATPLPLHAAQTVAALRAGKHCACAVTAACSVEDLWEIVRAERESGCVYMMMETAVYTYHFLYAKHLRDTGQLGRIQFLRGTYYQDMEGWPGYWAGIPPMYYGTHAIGPVLELAQTRATRVYCLGSGTLRDELQQQYGNPYPLETALFRLDGVPAAAEVTRSFFQTAREYVESFTVLGEDMGFEWHFEHELPVVFRLQPLRPGQWGRTCIVGRVVPPPRHDLLPPELHQFLQHDVGDDPTRVHVALMRDTRHHGSHAHLVHEYVRAIVEGRRSPIDSVKAAQWTAAGLCAHESAMSGGEGVDIPSFEE